MDPIYYFKLDPETGVITRTEITDYEEKDRSHHLSGSHYYKWKCKSQIKYFYHSDLDRFKNNHLYSFNGNIEEAKKVMLQFLKIKANKAFNDYRMFTDLIKNIEENQ